MVCKSLTLRGTSIFSNLKVWVLKKYFIFFMKRDYLPSKVSKKGSNAYLWGRLETLQR